MFRFSFWLLLTLSSSVHAQNLSEAGASITPTAQLEAMMPAIHQDLFQLYYEFSQNPQITPADATRRRRELMRALRAEPLPQVSNGKRAAIDLEEAKEILKSMTVHPVVGKEATNEIYDPTGRYGFCFGRAQWAAMELLFRDVSKDSIRKIFIIGPMQDHGINWQFHVATMVRSTDGGWLVIDNIYKKVQKVQDWMGDLQNTSVDKKPMFHVTDLSRLGASTTQKFTEAHFRDPMNDPEYNRFFEDMMASFRKLAKEKIQAREARSCSTSIF